MSPRDVIEMATMGGARALGMEKQIGSIEIGKKADIIIVASSQPHNLSNIDPYSALVYSSHPSDVRCSIIDGQVVVGERQLTNFDLQIIIAEANKITQRIKPWYMQRFPVQDKQDHEAQLPMPTAGENIFAGTKNSSLFNAENATLATQAKPGGLLASARAHLYVFVRRTAAPALVLGSGMVVNALIQQCDVSRPGGVCGL
jgi:hypothetical protein